MEGGRDIASFVNDLLKQNWALKIASRDFHPTDHISFVTQHTGKEAFTSIHTITSPKNPQETQETTIWPPHCVQGTEGCEFIAELDSSRFDMVVDKGQDKRVESYSAFGPPFENPPVSKTGLEDTLRKAGVTDVVVVGLAYDYCVKCTAIDAAKAGFGVTLLENGTRAVDHSKEALDGIRRELEVHGVRIKRD